MGAKQTIEEAVTQITERVQRLLQSRNRICIAIDGRCAAGKTTLAARLQQTFRCQVVHMDDFFLRPSQRTPERLASPGENVDHERFLEEVLKPWVAGEPFSYWPYDCHLQALGEPVFVAPGNVLVVEGSYSCHPLLRGYYDLHVFLDVDEVAQMERILMRNGEEAAKRFAKKWIPLEEAYFSTTDLRNRCDLCLEVK